VTLLAADAEEAAWQTAGFIVGAAIGAAVALILVFVLLRRFIRTVRSSAATMTPESTEPIDPAARFEAWQHALTDLINVYQDVQRRALTLPALAFGTSWGLWQGKRDMWSRLRVARGEAYASALAPRMLVDYLLAEHFAARLGLVKRSVLSDTNLRPKDQDRLLKAVDRVMPLWPRRPVLDLIITKVLPFSAIVTAVITGSERFVLRGLRQPPSLSLALFFLALTYLLVFSLIPMSAWVVKRGLMLGGRGALACTPVLLEGRGAYAAESRVFGPLAPARRELPLDLVFVAVFSLLLAAIIVLVLERFLNVPVLLAYVTVPFAVAVPLVSVMRAFRERRRLGRW
jgi:hypothetical protein